MRPVLFALVGGLASVAGPTLAQPFAAALAGQTGVADYDQVVKLYRDDGTPKIVGGQVAPDKAYPWQVSLQVSWIADPGAAHFCGGTVYREKWVITAAHCVAGLKADDIVVSAGVNNLGPGVRRTNLARIIAHENYNKIPHDSDIALLELKTPLKFDDRTKPATLITAAQEAAFAPGADLTVTGWGATKIGGDTVRDLRFVGVPFVDRDTCNKTLSYDGKITATMMCAGKAAGGADSCQGDSGGPLVVAGQPQLAGVVSWGQGCALPYKYGVYARIPPFASWIAKYVP